MTDDNEQPIDERDDRGMSPAAQKQVEHAQKLIKRTKSGDGRWRKRAQQGVDFYFGRQWDPADAAAVRQRGQEPIVKNITKPTIKVLIGLMLSQPYDWVGKPVGAHDDEAAERVTAGLKFLSGANQVNAILRDAYFWGHTYGVGWVMTGPYIRWDDPFREPCQVRIIDPREVGRDPDSRELDGSDMRFWRWSRKMPRDVAREKYKRPALSDVTTSDESLEATEGVKVNEAPIDMTPPPSMWDDFSTWNLDEQDDCDDEGRTVTIHEVWEVRKEPATLAMIGTSAIAEVPDGQEAGWYMRADVTRIWKDARVPRVYRSVLCGPLLLEHGRADEDRPETSKLRRIPAIPYYYEIDDHGDPVSCVDSIIPMQREVNFRRSKALHELGVQRWRVKQEILQKLGMSAQEFGTYINTPGAVVPGNEGDVAPLTPGAIAPQQLDLMRDSEVSIQKIVGTNDHLMGYDAAAESGKSKELSMQQGATMQRDAEAGLRAFHKALGEQLLNDMCAFHAVDPWIVRLTDEVGRDSFVTFNEMSTDPATGEPTMLYDINQYRYDVELDTVPFSLTMRQRASDRMVSVAQATEDPIMRAAFIKLALSMDDLPNKAKILDIVNEAEQQSLAAQQAAAAPQMPPPTQMPMQASDPALMAPEPIGLPLEIPS